MALDLVRGWFADRSDDRAGWSPHLQISGAILPLPVWFDTRDECENFIRAELIGQGWVDGPRRYPCPDCGVEGDQFCLIIGTQERRLTVHAERLRYLFGGWPS